MQSLQLQTKIDNTQPFHVYYDIEMININQVSGEATPNLIYNQTRNSPFLDCPNNYFVSIVRFNLQTPSLPIFIPQVELNQVNPNKLIYQFTIRNIATNTQYTNSVTFSTSNQDVPTPPTPTNASEFTNPYYYIYTYLQWVTMMNNALVTCSLNAGLTEYPFFTYNQTSGLLDLYVPTSYSNVYDILINKPLQSLLDSFPMVYKQISPGVYKHELLAYDTHKNTETINTVNYYVMHQENTTLPILNPVQSIVFTTSLLPIQPSLTQPPVVFGDNIGIFTNGNNAGISPIITDFEVNVSALNTYKESIQYNPTGEYRLFDLYGQTPCDALEIQVYWKDIYGILHPFKLNTGCSCNIKIMFRRKDFNAIDMNYLN